MKKIFVPIITVLLLLTAFTTTAQQRQLTTADFPNLIPKVDETLQGLKGNELTEKLLLAPYDGAALRLAVSMTSSEFLSGETAEKLISEISTLRKKSMNQLLPDILGRLSQRNRYLIKLLSSNSSTSRKNLFTLPQLASALAFITVVNYDVPDFGNNTPFSEFQNFVMGTVNEYEYVGLGKTMNVREEITYAIETRHVKFRSVKTQTIEQNEDSKVPAGYVVERGMFGPEPGVNTVKSIQPRRLRPTSTHRVTIETVREAIVDRCPDAKGITSGQTTSSVKIRVTAAASGNGAPAFTEVIATGNATGQVNEAATLTGYQWEVATHARVESLNTGNNFQLSKKMTMSSNTAGFTGNPLAFSSEMRFSFGEPNLTVGEVTVSGKGSDETARKAYSLMSNIQLDGYLPLLESYEKAQNEWRSGRCVELVVASGAEPKKISPGETRKLVVEARHSYDPPPIAIPVTGTSSGGKLTPETPVRTPAANYILKSDASEDNGSAVIFKSVSRRGIAGDVFVDFYKKRVPIKVSVQYFENVKEVLKQAMMPGTDIEGGNKVETRNMSHTEIFYHYPSQKQLEEGLLVFTEPGTSKFDSQTEHVLEVGHFNYSKIIEDAKVYGMIGNSRVLAEVQPGWKENYSGTPSIKNPSFVAFFQGTKGKTPGFSWSVEYPATNGEEIQDIAAGSLGFSKEDKGVKWEVKKINDPNSPYKTEYLLELRLDAAEEWNEQNKAMKELMGFDAKEIFQFLEPHKPKDEKVKLTGNREIIVRILSPYPDETEKKKEGNKK